MHQSNSISMLFTMPNYQPFDESDIYSSYASPNSSVDCTLSLGTPSTRLTNDTSTEKRSHRRSGFCWNILKPKQTPSPPPPATNKAGRGSSNVSGGGGGGDPLLARRCANCDTTSTPLWRNGPRGPKSLCNACGIRFKKEERRASAAAATTPTGGAPAGVMEHQYILNNSWAQHSHSQIYPTCYSPAAGNEFTFMENNSHGDMGDTGIPFLSWGLNVTDRSSFVHF